MDVFYAWIWISFDPLLMILWESIEKVENGTKTLTDFEIWDFGYSATVMFLPLL
jgi:hypothetical protein